MNERRQRMDNQPYGRAFERLNELLYPSPHPYHWPVIGYMDDIAAADLDDVSTFFRTHYAPDNAVLTLAGDFERTEAEKLIEAYFGEFAPSARGESNADGPVEHAQPILEVLPDSVQLERSYIAFRLPPYGTADWYAADLLAAELTAGKSSRLYRDLVYDRQIAQDISAMALPTELDGSFVVVATASEPGGAAELESAVSRHLEAVAAGEVPEAGLERARNQTLSSYFEALQSLAHRADLVSQFTTYLGQPNALQTELEAYTALRLEDLQRVADKYLRADRSVTVRVVPEATS